jgi:hypothetical protein
MSEFRVNPVSLYPCIPVPLYPCTPVPLYLCIPVSLYPCIILYHPVSSCIPVSLASVVHSRYAVDFLGVHASHLHAYPAAINPTIYTVHHYMPLATITHYELLRERKVKLTPREVDASPHIPPQSLCSEYPRAISVVG